MKLLRSASLLALALGIGLVTTLTACQSALLYPAPDSPLPAPLPAGVEQLPLGGAYGLFLRPETKSPVPVVVFTHGNGEAAHHWIRAARPLVEQGLGVLLVEFPGYGDAKGSPSLDSIRTVVLEAFDVLALHPDVDPNAIIAYGRSIGGGAACLLAAERPVAALALESTFTTLAELVSELGLPAFLLRDRYDNARVVEAFEGPVFLYHGSRDTLIGVHHGRALAALARDVDWNERTCGHNDCPRPWSEFVAFLSDRGLLARAPARAANSD